MASTSQTSAVEKLDDNAADSEPSMEDILASIRQIIAEDETPDDGLTERERYTHPIDPSNSNKPIAETDLDAGNTGTTAAAASQPPLSVEERAAEIRAQLAARHDFSGTKSDVNALRDSGVNLRTEALVEKLERETADLKDAAALELSPPPALSATPPIPRHVPTVQPTPISAPTPALTAPNVVAEQMASTMMREKGAEIDTMLSEMMRPIVRKWLGDNLPMLVERLVREEIERVSQGRQLT